MSFFKDVAPILKANCVACHSTATPQSGFNSETYLALMRGGKRGKSIDLKSPEKSLLVEYIDGRRQPRMPIGGALSKSEIQTINRWISEGAIEGKPITGSANSITIKPKIAVAQPVYSIAWSRDGKSVLLGGYKEVNIYDASNGKWLEKVTGCADIVKAISQRPNESEYAFAGGVPGKSGEIVVWNSVSHTSFRITGHSDSIYGVSWRPDGRSLVSASYDKTAKIWDYSTKASTSELRDHADAVMSAAYSDNGKYLVTVSADKSVKVWDGATGKRMYSLGGAQEAIFCAGFMPKSDRLYTAGADNVARGWDLRPDGGSQVKTIGGQPQNLLDVAISSDGTKIATACADGMLRIYQESDGRQLQALKVSDTMVLSVRFSPSGEFVVAGSADGKCTSFNVKSGTVALTIIK